MGDTQKSGKGEMVQPRHRELSRLRAPKPNGIEHISEEKRFRIFFDCASDPREDRAADERFLSFCPLWPNTGTRQDLPENALESNQFLAEKNLRYPTIYTIS